MDYHFDENSSPLSTFVANTRNTRSCPFSGRYSLTGSHSAMTGLLDEVEADECQSVSFFMQAGCSDSSDLNIESTCHPKKSDSSREEYGVQNDSPINVRSEFICHGQWSNNQNRQLLLLSSGPALSQSDNSLSRQFMCLEYSEHDGIMSASIVKGSCQESSQHYYHQRGGGFNITSSGPCLQALTGAGVRNWHWNRTLSAGLLASTLLLMASEAAAAAIL